MQVTNLYLTFYFWLEEAETLDWIANDPVAASLQTGLFIDSRPSTVISVSVVGVDL